MKIFKFGGASVKDAAGVRNVRTVLDHFKGESLAIVVSAMGKTTNALEEVIQVYQNNDTHYLALIDALHKKHEQIITDLASDTDLEEDCRVRFRESGLLKSIKAIIESLKGELLRNRSRNYSFLYDQVVSHGELLSTKIVAAYLNACSLTVEWTDARELIATNNKYRDAAVNWAQTEANVKPLAGRTFLTQGFIGADPNGLTTTLGREGSDYTAGILAYCLDAESVTIWKDVPGVLNADPRVFQDTELLKEIPYDEAIELAFYGASVIHPKTLQPLQDKSIPLHVRSFIEVAQPGSTVRAVAELDPLVPCYIVRKNMIYLEISSRDFSFIGEQNISEIFEQLSGAKMQVGLLQNSAISFRLCVEDKYGLIDQLLEQLTQRFKVTHRTGVQLYTIRHYNGEQPEWLIEEKVLLRQRTQDTLQIVATV